jgi:hypothetical protein
LFAQSVLFYAPLDFSCPANIFRNIGLQSICQSYRHVHGKTLPLAALTDSAMNFNNMVFGNGVSDVDAFVIPAISKVQNTCTCNSVSKSFVFRREAAGSADARQGEVTTTRMI